jgi:hypothetical protein
MLNTCTSTFSKGKFEQELVCTINTFGNPKGSADGPTTANGAANEREDAAKIDAQFNNRSGDSSVATSTNGAGTSSSDTNNQSFDDYNSNSSDDDFNSYTSTLPTDQQTVSTKNGPVQDDDASKEIEEDPSDDDGGREEG